MSMKVRFVAVLSCLLKYCQILSFVALTCRHASWSHLKVDERVHPMSSKFSRYFQAESLKNYFDFHSRIHGGKFGELRKLPSIPATRGQCHLLSNFGSLKCLKFPA